MYILYESRAVALGLRPKRYLLTEIAILVAAFIALVGTSGAVHFGDLVSKLKDADLKAYQKQADMQIALANKDSAQANATAQQAKLQAEETSRANALLQIRVSKGQIETKKAQSALAAKNEQNSQYTRALAVQQQTMAQQIHTSPELTRAQIDLIANALKPFSGQEVIMHRTGDTVVGRLGSSIANAFLQAGIKFPQYLIDIDQLYQGVTVVVHADQGHPLLADVLVSALLQQGIPVNKVAMDSIPAGKVALYHWSARRFLYQWS
jgi:hypothetical protein